MRTVFFFYKHNCPTLVLYKVIFTDSKRCVNVMPTNKLERVILVVYIGFNIAKYIKYNHHLIKGITDIFVLSMKTIHNKCGA